MDAGLTVTEAWPVQTESSGTRANALGAAASVRTAYSSSRGGARKPLTVGQYEAEVEPEAETHRPRAGDHFVGWRQGYRRRRPADGRGRCAGLAAYTRFSRVEYGNGEPVPARTLPSLDVEGVVLDVMLDEIFGMRGTAVGMVDPVTRFYILWRFTYRESSVEAGDVYVFSYPQGIEVDGQNGLAGPSPSLVEKQGSKFRVRNFQERGESEQLGIGAEGTTPLVDVRPPDALAARQSAGRLARFSAGSSAQSRSASARHPSALRSSTCPFRIAREGQPKSWRPFPSSTPIGGQWLKARLLPGRWRMRRRDKLSWQ